MMGIVVKAATHFPIMQHHETTMYFGLWFTIVAAHTGTRSFESSTRHGGTEPLRLAIEPAPVFVCGALTKLFGGCVSGP